MAKGLLTLCILIVFLTAGSRAGWLSNSSDQALVNAFVANQDRAAASFRICRARIGKNVIPGVVDPSEKCNINFDEKEHSIASYEVLTGGGYAWASVFDGDIPFDALPAGKKDQGGIIYICRGEVDSQHYPGIISKSDNGCIVSIDGINIKAVWYEVLIGNQQVEKLD